MIINEIVTSENLLNHAYFSQGEMWKFDGGWGSDLRERKKKAFTKRNATEVKKKGFLSVFKNKAPLSIHDIAKELDMTYNQCTYSLKVFRKSGDIIKLTNPARYYTAESDLKAKPKLKIWEIVYEYAKKKKSFTVQEMMRDTGQTRRATGNLCIKGLIVYKDKRWHLVE